MEEIEEMIQLDDCAVKSLPSHHLIAHHPYDHPEKQGHSQGCPQRQTLRSFFSPKNGWLQKTTENQHQKNVMCF